VFFDHMALYQSVHCTKRSLDEEVFGLKGLLAFWTKRYSPRFMTSHVMKKKLKLSDLLQTSLTFDSESSESKKDS
jgi:hypothetical protein